MVVPCPVASFSWCCYRTAASDGLRPRVVSDRRTRRIHGHRLSRVIFLENGGKSRKIAEAFESRVCCHGQGARN